MTQCESPKLSWRASDVESYSLGGMVPGYSVLKGACGASGIEAKATTSNAPRGPASRMNLSGALRYLSGTVGNVRYVALILRA
jgi:hypothetical protein